MTTPASPFFLESRRRLTPLYYSKVSKTQNSQITPEYSAVLSSCAITSIVWILYLP